MKNKKNIKNLFHTTGTRRGAYSVGLTVLVIAVAVVFNLAVGQLPEAFRNIDVSSTKIYEISDTSRNLLDGLDKDVDMKVLAVKDETDERITAFLSKYAALSDKLHVEWIDPVLHPSALTDYETTENTIVISCADTGKTTTVSFGDILVMDEYSYYYYGTASYTEFDGEGQLTGAVNYVSSDVEKTIYQTTGHGEGALSATVTDLMEKNSYTLSELNLLMTTSIPDDCDLLLMYAPVSDLSEDEAQLLTDYLGAGGKLMILLGDTSALELPNLEGILNTYGIQAADGYIADPTRCYQNNPYYIFPELSVYEDMAEGIESQMVLLTNTHGMTLADPERDTIATSAFMSSSEQSYAVTEDAQQQGSYVLGATASETVSTEDHDPEDDGSGTDESENGGADAADTENAENAESTENEESMENAESTENTESTEGTSDTEDTDTGSEESGETLESRLTVISAASLIDQSITDTFPQLENTQIFMNAVSANFDGVQNLSIEAKSLGVEYNTVQHAGLFSMLMIFGIPAVVLIGGFVVWFRRRRA